MVKRKDQSQRNRRSKAEHIHQVNMFPAPDLKMEWLLAQWHHQDTKLETPPHTERGSPVRLNQPISRTWAQDAVSLRNCAAVFSQRLISVYGCGKVQAMPCITSMRIHAIPLTIHSGIWGFPKMVVPQNGWFRWKFPVKYGWFGGTPISGNLHINTPQTCFCFGGLITPHQSLSADIILGSFESSEQELHFPMKICWIPRYKETNGRVMSSGWMLAVQHSMVAMRL